MDFMWSLGAVFPMLTDCYHRINVSQENTQWNSAQQQGIAVFTYKGNVWKVILSSVQKIWILLSQNLFVRFKSLRVCNLQILNLGSVEHDLKRFYLVIYKETIGNKYFRMLKAKQLIWKFKENPANCLTTFNCKIFKAYLTPG